MIMLKSGHFKFEAPSSKRHARYDLPESGERVKKKPKRTGHGLRSFFKRMRGEESEPVEPERDMDQGTEERVHSPSSEKTYHLKKKKDVSCSEDVSDSGRDLVLGEEDRSKEASKVDERGTEKNTNEENSNSVNESRKEDRCPIPLKQKVKVEDQSAGRDIGSYVDDIQKKCDKRMKKLVQKQRGQIEEFHRTWEADFSKLETDYKLEAAFIRSIYLASSKLKLTDKLEILESEFAKKRAENNLQKEMKLKELEEEQLAERNDEIQKADIWLAEAKARICGKQNCSSKAQSSGSQNEETSRGSESKIHIGTKDVVPLSQKLGENTDSDSGNPDDVVLSMLNKNPSLELEISPRNEGGISSSDTQIPDLVDQISQRKQSGDVPLGSSQTVAEGIVNDTNPVNISTTTLIEGIAEADAINLPDAENSGRYERISPNRPASGESVFDDVQSVELHGDIPSELLDTVANENLDDANMMDSITETPTTLFGEGDAIDLPDEEHFTQPKHFGSDGMHEGPVDPAETAVNEIVDIVNPEELSANISIEGFGETGALHPSDASLSQGNETDRTTIDDLGFDGQVLETSEQTESLQPCPQLPLQVQEVQDKVSAAIQVDDEGKIKSTPSEIVVSKLVDSVAKSLSNIEPQACEEPAIETQSPSATVVSTSEIIDTVITKQSSLKSHDHDKSIDKHQVASIKVADSEIVDAEAPVSVSEVVDTAETLQSILELQEQVEPVMETQNTSRIEVTVPQNLRNAEEQVEDASTAVAISEVVDTAETLQSILELQEQVEPLMETQSMSRIKLTVPQNLSNAEEQVEDASIAVNEVSLGTDVSNAGMTYNLTPVQSHLDAPPMESFSHLQLTDTESQNRNMESNPSEAVKTVALSDDSMSQLMGDLLGLINTHDAPPENQSSPATRVQTSASLQNYAAAEGVTQLRSHQAAAPNPLSLVSDPLINELEKNHRETGALQKSYQETMSGLKSEYEKEKEELIAQVKKKYQLKFDDTVSQFTLKKNHLQQSLKKIVMNKLLTDTFRLNCSNTPSWPLMQQGFSASSTQCHQQLVRPTAPNPQISCPIGQTAVHQALVNHDPRSAHVTSRNGQPLHQASVHHDTRSTHVTSRNGQPMQQLRAPPHHSMRLGPITNHNFAAQSVQAAQQVAPTVSGLRGINSVLPTAVTHFGENIQSFPHFQASTPAVASSMATSNISQTLWNLQQMQLLQQQQSLAAPQWRSNSQNFQHLGYPLQVLAQNHQNHGKQTSFLPHFSSCFGSFQESYFDRLGGVEGNRNSFVGATTAICLSDDD